MVDRPTALNAPRPDRDVRVIITGESAHQIRRCIALRGEANREQRTRGRINLANQITQNIIELCEFVATELASPCTDRG
jgi:hypothetical protein